VLRNVPAWQNSARPDQATWPVDERVMFILSQYRVGYRRRTVCRRIASNVDVTLAIFSRDFVAQLYRATKSPYRYAAVTIAICNCNKSQETWFLHHCFLLILFQKLSAQLDSMR